MFRHYLIFFCLGFIGYPLHTPKLQRLTSTTILTIALGTKKFGLDVADSRLFAFKFAALGLLVNIMLILLGSNLIVKLGLSSTFVLVATASWLSTLYLIGYISVFLLVRK